MEKTIENLLFGLMETSRSRYHRENEGRCVIEFTSMTDALSVQISQEPDRSEMDVKVKLGTSFEADVYQTVIHRTGIANFLTFYFLNQEHSENFKFLHMHGRAEFDSIKMQALKILSGKPSERFEFTHVEGSKDGSYRVHMSDKNLDVNCMMMIKKSTANDLSPLHVWFSGIVQSPEKKLITAGLSLFLEAHTLEQYPLIAPMESKVLSPTQMLNRLLSANEGLKSPSKVLQKFKLDTLLEEKNDEHGPRVKI